jgi:hypothetical protein
MTIPGWQGDPERSIVVRLRMVKAMPFVEHRRILAEVGSHGLARRFERGADRRDLALIRDMLALVPAAPGILARGGECEIAVSGGGLWIGSRMGCDGRPVVGIRTFVA